VQHVRYRLIDVIAVMPERCIVAIAIQMPEVAQWKQGNMSADRFAGGEGTEAAGAKKAIQRET
jgi:hypothetical protein